MTFFINGGWVSSLDNMFMSELVDVATLGDSTDIVISEFIYLRAYNAINIIHTRTCKFEDLILDHQYIHIVPIELKFIILSVCGLMRVEDYTPNWVEAKRFGG